ncbi:MAG: sigma-70 family RNA polymerase sigma factor [Acidobacteria bacterium]|nr:sigma-70 family RNA polymerase sigma factor [Acidobacteriota bacterium]
MPEQVDLEERFRRLTEEYGAGLRRLAAAYEPDAAARQDLLQEIAAAVWTALPRFRGDSGERTWIYRIAHNVASTARFRARRRQSREVAWDGGEQPAGPENPESRLQQRQRRTALTEALRRLPTLDFQIAMLHLEELSNAEIADVVGLQPGAVATRLTRIRHKLADDIQNQGGSR